MGNRVRVKVVKNKMAPAFPPAEASTSIYGGGISHEGDLIDLGLEHGLVQKSGAFFSYGEDRLGPGSQHHPARSCATPRSVFAELEKAAQARDRR